MKVSLSENKPNLIWLEDRETTARIELGIARQLDYAVHVRAHPIEIVSLLDQELGSNPDEKLLETFSIAFVIDVMISGLLDLSALEIKHSETHGGLNGGYVFADRVLREANSCYRFRPICFLSERQLTPDLENDLQYLRDRNDSDGRAHGPVEYVRKWSSNELARFKEFLGKL